MFDPLSNKTSRVISKNNKPFLIAEIGLNHNKNLDIAKKLIQQAAESGADAVKFQSYTTEKFIYKDAPKINDLFNIFKKYELSFEEHKILKEFADQNKIFFFSTPLSLDWVDLLERLNVFGYKIASGDLNCYSLLKKVIQKQKIVIISTGAATLSNIQDTVNFFKKYSPQKNCENLILLHCVSLYPTPLEKANLYRMHTLEEKFKVLSGFSDHTQGITAASYASFLGATVIEKHFTLDKNMEGPDHILSATPEELAGLRKQIDLAFEMRKNFQEDAWPEEMKSDYFGKRSVYNINGEEIEMRPRNS